MPNTRGVSAWKPKTVELKDLENTVCEVFNSIGFDIGNNRLNACHRIRNSGRTIVKFP